MFLCLSNQVSIKKAFPHTRLHHPRHPRESVQPLDVVPPCEFSYVAVQMLLAHPVVRAFVGSLEQGPERFDAVGVYVISGVLTY